VHDAGGITASTTFTATILDDAPKAIADTRTVTEDQTGITGNLVTGVNATADTLGADSVPATSIVTGAQVSNAAGAQITGGVNTPLTGTYGTLTLQANGSYTYVTNAAAQALNAGDSKTDVFSYTIKDSDGDFSTTTVTFTVEGLSDGPSISAPLTSAVSEEGLVGGIADTTGTNDTTNEISNTGQFAVANATSVALSVPSGSYTSGGAPITWALSPGSQTLTGTAGGQTVMTVVIDNTGKYTTTLLKPFDHPVKTTEDILTLDLTVTATNGTASSTSTLTVNVEDDAPFAPSSTNSVTLNNVDTNIELILDVSTSMGWSLTSDTNPAAGQPSRMDKLKEAVNSMLSDYANLGNVRVHVVSFSSSATDVSQGWVDVATARNLVNGLTPNGSTNYDAALTTGMSAWTTAGKIVGAQNVAYFLSDGAPTANTNGTNGIQPAEEAAWTNFLISNKIISSAYALGNFGATAATINPIAYNGVTSTNTNGVLVPDISLLPPILRDSVIASTSGALSTTGSLAVGVGFGGDGGYMTSVALDGATYTYNPTANTITQTGITRAFTYDAATHKLTFDTTYGGKFVITVNTGEYTYTPSPSITKQEKELLDYVMVDKDGDAAPLSTLTLTVNPAGTPATPTYEASIISVEPGLAGVGDNNVNEGSTLVYTVALSSATTSATSYNYVLGGGTGTATGGTATTGDYNATATFSNGVTYSAATGKITVPSGVTSFTVSVTTRVDVTNESTTVAENVRLTIGGITGIGGILDTPPPPAVTTVVVGTSSLTDDAQIEGHDLTYAVTLASATTANSSYAFIIGGNATTGHYDATPVFSNGVTLSGGNIIVPTGVLNFTVVMHTVDDAAINNTGDTTPPPETLSLTIGGVIATAGIVDNDQASQGYRGTNNADNLTGTAGAESIYLRNGTDTVDAGGGDDYINGGTGNDNLTGGSGSDTFAWKLADKGTVGTPAADIVTDFTENAGDKLDLRDLLQGENHASGIGNLANYLHFESVAGGNVLLHVSSAGNLTTNEDQRIQLNGTTLATLGGSLGTTDAAIIQNLLNNGKLIVD
jgi:VCBS repeat-containing protein